MNNSFYKIIFNKNRGQLMVVSEIAQGQGKNTATRCAVNVSSSPLYVPLKVMILSLLVATGVLLDNEAEAQIRADKAAPRHQQATVLQTANGLDQVNIQTPTAAGVSVNQFSQFDVQQQGAILNNSRQSAQTQLAGWVQGNPHLARGEANVIVNQVNSRAPSRLQGFTEVAGRRAEVVIANPAGIAVDGGGFINAQGVTLATGQMQLNAQGQLTGVAVNQGTVQVLGGGLNTKDANYTQILSHAATIEGGIWANDLSVSTGEQDIVFDAKDLNQSAKLMNQADTQHRAATAERDAKQSAAIAIDVAQLGGMYANSIVLISNDKGVGVNNSGQLYAGAGRLQLSADGQLSNSGEMVASAANTAEPVAKVQITSTSLQNQGTIAAPEVSIKAAQIHNTKGFVTASKTLQIESTELANSEQGQLKAGRLDIQTERLENIQSGIVQTGTQALNINSAALTNSGQLGTAVISDPVSSDIDPENPSSGDAPSPTEPGQQTPSSSTALGKTTTETVVSPALAAGRIQVERNITNDEGQISANGDVHLSLSQALDNQGDIQVKSLQSKGEQLRNAGYINAERLDLEHRHLDNRQGHLYSSNAIALTTETLDNRAGQISTRDSLLIDNQGRLDNSQGQLLAAQAITLNTQAMHNTQGQLVTGKSLSVSVEEALHDQQGQWQALEALRIHAGELQSEQSRFSTDDDLQLTSQGQLVLTEAQLSAQHSLHLQGDGVQMKDTEAFAEQLQVLSSGELQSQGAQWQAQQVQVEAVDWQNLQGEIVAEKDLIIRSNSLDNQQGRLVSGEVMSVHLDQDLINQQGLLQAGQALDIRARNLHSEEGTLAAQGPAQLAIAEIFDQSGGLTTIGGKLMLSSRRLINRGGHLESAQSLALHVDEAIDNTEGRLQTLGDMEVMTAGQVVNTQGQLMAGEALTLHAERLDTQAGQIASTGALTLTVDDELNANQAQLVSNKSLKLQAASLDASAASFVTEEQMQLNVRDKLLAQDSQWQAGKGIALNADSIDLTSSKMAAAAIQASAHSDVIVSSGLLQADESMLLQAKAVKADHGYLSAGERVQVNASQLFDHQQGTLLSGGDVQLDVGQFLNEQGSLYAASTIQIDATQDIKSVQSDIQSGGELLVRAAGSIHQGGRLLAAEQLTLQAQQLQHEEAQLQGHVVTLQSADGLHLRDSTLLSATQVQLHSGGDSYLDETTVQAEDDVEFRAQARADLKQSQLHSRQGSVLLDAQESHQQDSQLVAKEINLSLSNELKAEDGYWLAEEGLTIQTPTLQMTSMNTQADTLTIQSVGDVLHDQSVTVVDGELRIDAKNLSNHAGQLVSAKRLEVTASGTVDNSAGLMISDGQMVLNQESLINTKGKLHAAENLTIQASQGIDSLDSEIVSAESIQIQAATKVQLGGVLFAEESLDVEGFEQRYDAAHLQAKEISLSAQGDLALTKSTLLAEEAASLVSGANLSLNEVQGQAQGVFTIDVEEQATLEQSDLQSVGGPLSIRAATQQHHQSTLLAEDIKLTAGQTLGAETSQWVAHNNLDLAVGSLDLTQHQSQAEAIQLNSQGRIEQQDSLMQADKTLEIKAQALTNRGSDITAGTDLVIKTSGHVDNHEGLLLADGSLKIQAAELRNEQGRVASQGSTELGIDGLLNNQQGLIATSDELILHVGSLHNQAGQVSTKQAMKVVVGEEFNNQAGLVVSDASFDLNVGHLFNQAGQLQAKTDFHLTAKQAIDNLQGEIVAGGSANLHSQGALVNSGVIAAGDTLAIQAEQITQEGGHLQAEQLALKAKQAIAMSDESTVLATDSAELSAGTNLSLADTQIQTLNKLQLQAGQKIAMQDTDLQSQQGDVSLDAKSIVQANTTLGGKNLALSASDNIQAEDSQWLADSTLQATSDVLNLHRLSSAAEQIKLQANQGLKHHDSVMVAEQSVHLQAAAMTNQGGQIAAGENLQINAGQLLDNQEGALVAQQDLQITASIVTNQQGKLSAQQDLQVTASQSVNNQSGLMVADGALLLSSPIVINKGGQISAANLLAINNNTSVDNQSGLLVSDGDIRLETSSLENSRGQIHAKGNTTIQASQRITNHGGEILAAKTVSLLDSAQQRNQRRLQIEQDANGVIQGNEGTVLIAQELRSQARIETPGHLQLDVTEGFNNLGGLQAGGSLSLITDKHLHNTQTIYSPDELTVQASDIHNDSTGELLGETAVTVVAKTGDIVNRGLINSNGVTTVEAAGTIDNIGSGRIYGDHVAIQSKTLLNREVVQATGERKAAVIAARERLDIGVHSLRNQEEGLLFSGGDLAIGARLDVNKQAQGQASNLINSAATIESLGDMYLNVHSIRNLNPDFELTRVQVSMPERFDFIVHDGQGYETRVDKKDLKERRWSRRAWEFVSKEPGDYANLVPGETPLWSLAQPACYSFSGNDCFTSTQLTNYEKYSPDNPAWAYFGITPGIATEPLAPRAPTEPTVSEPSKSCTFISDSDDRKACSSATQAWRDYRQNLASYQEQYAQYQVAYDTWMQVDGQRWHALDQAITAYNKDYQHQFKHRYTEYWITRTEYEDQVAHSRPGDIIAGGNLTINADTLTNDKSRIVAGKALKVDARHIDNIDAKGLRIIEDEGTSRYAWERWRGGLRRYHQREHGPVTPFLMTEQSTIDLPVSVYQAYSQVSSTGVSPNQLAEQAEVAAKKQLASGQASDMEQAAFESDVSVARQESEHSIGQDVSQLDREAFNGSQTESLVESDVAQQLAQGKDAVAPLDDTTTMDLLMDRERPLGSTNGDKGNATIDVLMQSLPQEEISTLSPTQVDTPTITTPQAPSYLVPTSSLYSVDPTRTSYLVETDPAFANQRQWLSSDYMLQALNQDPARMQKRLGDGYYEQRLLREQILQLTGQRFLDGYDNDEEQFKALMERGVSFAMTQGLTPGIELTAAQVARLTSDIVWLESQTVTLANGTTQEVLVPRVYVKPRQGDLAQSGALLAGNTVELQVKDGFINSGTVAGREIVSIKADTIDQEFARIQAKRVELVADRDITLAGSTVSAEELVNIRAGNQLDIKSTTYHTQTDVAGTNGSHFSGERQGIDRLASIHVSGDEAQLLLSAGNDMTLTGALVSHSGRDGLTYLGAGGDLQLDTVTVGYRQDSVGSASHYIKEQRWQDVGTEIQAVGDIILDAGNDARLTAARITSDDGLVQLRAQQDIEIGAGTLSSQLDERHLTKSRSLLGSKSKDRHWIQDSEQALGSEVTGREVLLQSGQDLRVIGSDVISDEGTYLQAGRDISLAGAEEYAFSDYHEKTKRSGVFGTGGIGVTIGSQSTEIDHERSDGSLRGTLVGSLAGDTVIEAGRQYSQEASTVSSPEGHVLITGQVLEIAAGKEGYSEHYRRVDKQSGLTVAVNVPVVDAMRKVAHAVESIGESSNRRTQAMAVANTAWSAYEGLGQVMGDPVGVGEATNQNVRVSITYGSQKSQTEDNQAGHTVAPSQVLAGKTVTLVATGAGEDSNILIRGADVVGNVGTHLAADNQLLITSAEGIDQSRSKNSSSGWNAGLALEFGQGGTSMGVTAGANQGKGHANADSVTHRHSHVGSLGSLTSLSAGGSTTLAGAQVFGEEVHVKTPNLIIQSVQDTATYEGKQQNLGGQLTVGYGVSGSANYNRSALNADYASVTEQSGIYAGDGGYQIEVAEHTELIGGLITSTAAAEAAGNNRFSTGTLSVSDLVNHAEFKGSSIGLGASGGFNSSGSGDGLFDQRQSTSDKTGLASAEASGSIGYGQVSESEGSTTYSGINTKNILITDEAKQTLLTGLSAEAMAERVLTATTTENAEALSGALENRFDAAALQKELDTQREVSQAFSQNVQSAKAELNQVADRLAADYEAGRISQAEYEAKRQQLDNGALLLSTIAAGLSAPTDSALGMATATLSPSVAKEIGQYFKSSDREGSTEHLIAHGLLAAAVAATGGNNALSAAGAAVSAEAAAPILADYLYGKEATELNADEKATISSITGLVGAGVGGITGVDSNLAQGAQSAGTAVDNNWLSPLEYQRRQELVDKSLEKGVLGLGQRDLTLEEAREFIDLVEKDAYADNLLARYQADSSSLSPQETQILGLILEQVSGGDPELALRILDMPIADGKVEDSYVSELYSKALQQVGVYESMDMKLAKAAEPALYFMTGPVGAVVRGVSAAAGGYSIGLGSAAIADGQLVDGSMQVMGGTLMVAPVFAQEALLMGFKTPNSLVLRPVAGTGSKGISYEPALTDTALLVKAGVTDANVLKAVSNAKKISTANVNQSIILSDLREQLFWKEVASNPSKGKGLIGMNNDPRFPESAGFQKMTVNRKFTDGKQIEIHYQYNRHTDKAYDMKIVVRKPSKE